MDDWSALEAQINESKAKIEELRRSLILLVEDIRSFKHGVEQFGEEVDEAKEQIEEAAQTFYKMKEERKGVE
jgi:uncharacterized coiled-coil DUF342 family protein